MKREYHKWFSPALRRDMELLIFGHSGASVLFFPTRGARFYDYENWKVIDSLHDKINKGQLMIFCVDSVDKESFYNKNAVHPKDKIKRHLEYETYILKEVMPFMTYKNPNGPKISAGCSMGAYHAVNLAFKHPHHFVKVVGMSGRYDLTQQIGVFKDLFDGYRDEDIYYNMPAYYLPNLSNENILNQLRRLDIVFAIGEEDAFFENNIQMSKILRDKNIANRLYIWSEEAHKAYYWRDMVLFYL